MIAMAYTRMSLCRFVLALFPAIMALDQQLPAQTPGNTPEPPVFQTVSVRPNRSQGGENHMKTSPGRLTAENITPQELLGWAFGDTRITGGPGWLASYRFDLTAVTGTSIDLNRTTLPPFLQAMFVDRFHLGFHRETREFPNYTLMVAKGGPKLTAHSGEGKSAAGIHAGAGKARAEAVKTNMQSFASLLSRQTDRDVVDMTGLTGEYDFSLEWAQNVEAEKDYPSLFTALQEQLGLRLESTRGPAEVIVIDSIEKPTEN